MMAVLGEGGTLLSRRLGSIGGLSRINGGVMSKDYSTGRYAAYGYGAGAPLVGYLEDGMLRSNNGTWLFRVDGDEVYGAHGDYVGEIEEGVAVRPSGQFIFRLEAD